MRFHGYIVTTEKYSNGKISVESPWKNLLPWELMWGGLPPLLACVNLGGLPPSCTVFPWFLPPFPGGSKLRHFLSYCPLPTIFWSSFPIRVPFRGLSRGIGAFFPQGVSYPSPCPYFDLRPDVVLVCPPLELSVCHLVLPVFRQWSIWTHNMSFHHP